MQSSKVVSLFCDVVQISHNLEMLRWKKGTKWEGQWVSEKIGGVQKDPKELVPTLTFASIYKWT